MIINILYCIGLYFLLFASILLAFTKVDIEKCIDVNCYIYLNKKTNSISDFIFKIEPYIYGLIAEDVEQVLPALVVKNNEGQPYTICYDMLSVLLLKEIQKQ